jgi:hypothetical protein
MKINSSFASLASAVLVLALGVPLTASADEPATYQTADIHTFPDGVGLTGGAGTLTRTKRSVTARLYASGLDMEAAYTVWWVVWNDPSECAGTPCGLGDLGGPGNSVFYATGFVTGADGTANVSAHVNAGSLRDGIDVLIPGGLDAGNGFDAEIHMIIRSHGGILAGLVSGQIGSFSGSCDINVCEDQQAIAFLP